MFNKERQHLMEDSSKLQQTQNDNNNPLNENK